MIAFLLLNKPSKSNTVIKLSLCILLILQNWTASYAQSSSDTSKCYGVTNLRKIALKLTQGQECDTLLKLADSVIVNRNITIDLLNDNIQGYKMESSLKESIISRKQQEIDTINLQLKKTKQQLWLTKAGWLLTTLGLSATTVYFIIH